MRMKAEMERKEREETDTTRSRAALLARLLDASRRLAETRSLDTLLNQAMDVALALFGAETGFLILLDEQNRLDFRVRRTAGGKEVSNPAEQISQTILSQVIHNKQDLVIADALDPSGAAGITDSMMELQIRSVICVPLIARGKTLGALYLENRSLAGVFTEKDLPPMKLFASQVAVTVENALLNDRLEALVAKRTTALAQANQELEQTIGDLRLFTRALAHDVKTPLGVIMGYAGVLEEYSATLSMEDRAGYAAAIVRSAQKINQIIEGLLLLASVRDKSQTEVSPLDMGAIINDALEQVHQMTTTYHATITRQASWPQALGYAPWIEEVWVNYISNAIKYGGEPPVLELGSDILPNQLIRFWVRDNGKGISKEDQAKIFRPFVRLDDVKTNSGHGLGLTVVKQIIDRLDGQIGLESEPGVGSLFYFTLPTA